MPIATTEFRSRIYDPVNSGYLALDTDGRSISNTTLPENAPVSLGGFRARSRPAG